MGATPQHWPRWWFVFMILWNGLRRLGLSFSEMDGE
jgi:hypothetical protein